MGQDIAFESLAGAIGGWRADPVAVPRGGILVVQGGRFRELRAGRLEVGVVLGVAGQEVAKQGRKVELPRVLKFGDGVAIREQVPVPKLAGAEPEPAAAS